MLRRLPSRLSSILRRSRFEQDMTDELRAHLELRVDALAASGLTPDEARRRARIEFGSVEAYKDRMRDARRLTWFDDLRRDARHTLRSFRRSPLFTTVAVVTLALGIGANAAIFGVVDSVLLEPLSYPDPDRLVLVWERNAAVGKDRDLVAPRNYQDWRAQNTVFDELAAYRFGGLALSGVDYPERAAGVGATASLFRVLGVEAAIGRTFTEAEERRADRVIVLRHEFWQRRFGGDRAIVGQAITLNDEAYTVVGVMPRGFPFPDGNPVDRYGFYVPLVLSEAELVGRRQHTLTVIGRLSSAVTRETATEEMTGIARAIAADDPASNPDVALVGAHELLVEDVRGALLVLLGAVGLVLLVACANVSNLLLARASARQGEIALRAMLGAGRGRLVRQMLTESVLLAVLGGVAGLLLAFWVLASIERFGPADVARLDQARLDLRVLLFAAATALSTGVLFGMVPVLGVANPRLWQATSRSRHRADGVRGRRGLVVAEVALSLMLVTAAGLMIRSFLAIRTLDLGFAPRQLLTLQIFLPDERYPIDSGQFGPAPPPGTPAPPLSRPASFFAQLLERVSAIPGVESAGAVSSLPLNPVGIDYDLPVVIEGKPPPQLGEEPQADFRMATADYFRTMQVPVLRGRAFTPFDGPTQPDVVIVNDLMAQRLFPGEDPLGRRLLLYGRAREIVGVVGSVRHRGFSQGARLEMIVPSRQFQLGGMTLVVRSNLDPVGLADAIKREASALDSDLPVFRVHTMDEYLSDSIASPRFTTLLLGSFAVMALLLAAVGIYGVMSYTVTQREWEIGVRMALGARPERVLMMVVGQGMTLTAAGVALGLIGAAAGTRLMAGLLFGVTRTDPATFIVAAAVLATTGLVALYVPARRATRVDPVVALRSD